MASNEYEQRIVNKFKKELEYTDKQNQRDSLQAKLEDLDEVEEILTERVNEINMRIEGMKDAIILMSSSALDVMNLHDSLSDLKDELVKQERKLDEITVERNNIEHRIDLMEVASRQKFKTYWKVISELHDGEYMAFEAWMMPYENKII